MEKRDLKADLELCNKATPGPWVFNGISVLGAHGLLIARTPNDADAEFIAQAREGWPHAIERALKAERALGNETILNGKALAKLNERADKYKALVRELVYSLKLIRGSSQFSHTTWEEITDLSNIALIGAEEVLGDDQNTPLD